MKSKILNYRKPTATKKRILILMIAAFATVAAFAQNGAKRAAQFNLENGIALQGYDPVGYFRQHKAVKGKKELQASYDGVAYCFSTVANKEAFAKNPSDFEPQYGGWCAYAMGAKGEKVEVDPETFKILDGKLYLFYNAYFNNTLKSWNTDQANLKKKADASWKKITN